MSGVEFALLWLAWVLAGGSPGPATLGIAGTSLAEGRKAGLVFALGILAGSAAWGLAAILGLSAMMLANAWLLELIRYVGAGYLLYLAVKSLRSALSEKKPLLGRTQGAAGWRLFTKGALIHLTNPKAVLSWGAVYAIALPADAAFVDLVGLFAFLYSGSILVFVGYAFLFSVSGMSGAYARARRWFELGFAALFGAAAVKIFTARLT